MKVGRYNYPAQFPNGTSALLADLERMILKGAYVLSGEVSAFEKAYAAWNGTQFAKGVNTGTDALAVTFAALGVEPGDEIIAQANTFNATINSILMVGATPVLVDADPRTYLMDVSALEPAITDRTKVIAPVHLYGKPTPMAPILEIAARRGLRVVEDAAQSHGARIDGRMTGAFGVAGCYSFHPSKNLAAGGDGGMIVTNDPELAQAVDEVRSLGQRGQNQHVRPGFNSKLDSIQARILHEKLPYIDEWNSRRRDAAAKYRARLAGLPLEFQAESQGEEHVYHLFQVRTSLRDELLKHLIAADVEAVIRYPQAIHTQPAFAKFGWRRGDFPVAEALAAELLCLPIRSDLSDEEIGYVCETVREFFGN